MSWVQALGWAGSALLVFSILQARVLRFRVLNLLACLILVVFNAVLHIWPMVAMNVVLAVINLWFIRRLLADRTDDQAYTVLQVAADDTYLQHFLQVHAGDIARYFPHLGAAAPAGDRTAYLVLRGDETVGAVVVRDAGGGVAQVELDYVTPRFRDFSPGEFVYRRSGLFTERGFRRIVTPPGMVNPYYERLGFTREGDSWTAELV
ncbi:hypothetical protein SAMN05216199_1925 [Pedococcus cremeus]|uniref:YgjV family protein n=1 Tax=Pedococcus cremeus TaxID=587636 RepID=A0A1H9UHV7_9MICO|nr:hypothetical protein [Pedococcus cremeus]SES08858.1 hypothetical protein SAMN05216199_1925 [Pedococcus cremeus]